MSHYKRVVNAFREFIFDKVELERVRGRLKDAAFDEDEHYMDEQRE